jgi:diadenosine tetraphosphate (Ap4A) HIT family hydrolase
VTLSEPHRDPRIEAARAGTDPALICRVPSGWVFLCNLQFLRGYCILRSDPAVASINALGRVERAQFLGDMTLVGDALLEVTGACRINYALASNRDPVLHAHIVPRYPDEPEALRQELPWSYPNAYDTATGFVYERDKELIGQLAQAIQKLL